MQRNRETFLLLAVLIGAAKPGIGLISLFSVFSFEVRRRSNDLPKTDNLQKDHIVHVFDAGTPGRRATS